MPVYPAVTPGQVSVQTAGARIKIVPAVSKYAYGCHACSPAAALYPMYKYYSGDTKISWGNAFSTADLKCNNLWTLDKVVHGTAFAIPMTRKGRAEFTVNINPMNPVS